MNLGVAGRIATCYGHVGPVTVAGRQKGKIMSRFKITATVIVNARNVDDASDNFLSLVATAVDYGHLDQSAVSIEAVEEISEPMSVTLTLTDREQEIVTETLRRFRDTSVA